MCKVFCELVCVYDFKIYPRDLDFCSLIPPSPFFLSIYKNISSKSLSFNGCSHHKASHEPIYWHTPTDAQVWVSHSARVSGYDMSSMIHESK